MPSKKKKYNARFPAGRIKKIMQSDEEIGKVAQAVPVIISRTLELFVESNDINDHSSRLPQDTAIAPPICNYDLLSKPIVKIDYSNVQMTTTTLCPSGDDNGSTSTAMLNLNIVPPVINIDLTNIVTTGALPTPTKISYGKMSADKTNINGNNNNSITKFGSSVNYIAEKIKTPNIPKATSASAPISESLFELDEDYDNI
ncbi:hypothetical protein AWZ03_013486 [Drosophila navojoa]|uniref:Transcription factor CBF/NF-Y/archaeal histone domain-containing protein n=1 Tax=Drosophila navojoa TaxID=7232 RepID=A0A484AWV1_DRONA|nr:hypothetical protein AWZ03_013486 [Drosophila navojoa]